MGLMKNFIITMNLQGGKCEGVYTDVEEMRLIEIEIGYVRYGGGIGKIAGGGSSMGLVGFELF